MLMLVHTLSFDKRRKSNGLILSIMYMRVAKL